MKPEQQIRWATIMVAAPSLLVAIALLWNGPYSPATQWSLTALLALLCLWAIANVHHRVVYPLRTISNMLGALRERDFSMRARGARNDDALGEVLLEVNSLANLLREQRLNAMETSALLRRIMAEIDVGVLAFNDQLRLQMANGFAERLLGITAERTFGKSASELGLGDLLEGETHRIVDRTFAGRTGRWEIRRGSFIEGGQTQHLVLLSDLTRTLREEERQAWQRMVHVLRHEVNNSLAPISSVAESLTNLLGKQDKNGAIEDLREGLAIIADRSKSLTRFMIAYSQLTRLPKPTLRPFDVGRCVHRVAGLETRLTVKIKPGPDLIIQADPDQIEQLMLNLVRNGAEAALETGGTVTVGWQLAGESQCELFVEDEGLGLSNPANLFVPFYTTKPNGSGIGLALCRQIAEGHGGSVTLQNRDKARGCRAVCRLPMSLSVSEHSIIGNEHI